MPDTMSSCRMLSHDASAQELTMRGASSNPDLDMSILRCPDVRNDTASKGDEPRSEVDVHTGAPELVCRTLARLDVSVIDFGIHAVVQPGEDERGMRVEVDPQMPNAVSAQHRTREGVAQLDVAHLQEATRHIAARLPVERTFDLVVRPRVAVRRVIGSPVVDVQVVVTRLQGAVGYPEVVKDGVPETAEKEEREVDVLITETTGQAG